MGIVWYIYNVYLCTRFMAYCAGLTAINTFRKSDLAFSLEVV